MTNLLRLYLVMLRYRIAAMVAMFMLLGAASTGAVDLGVAYLWAAIALGSSYVAATALNDLADEQIDRVNHPLDAGRPLVEGTASRRELLALNLLASLLAVAAATPLGIRAVGLLGASLAISQVYSARPARLSYRVAGAPIALGIAYVLVPCSLGIVAANGTLRSAPSRLTCALFLFFTARIVLKDFRDRAGDAQYGKPTLLLRYGKTATCAASLAALASADTLLALAVGVRLTAIVQPLIVGIAWMLWSLWRDDDPRGEQIAIGLGARLGNGVLLSVLAWMLVEGSRASSAEACTVAGGVCALFLFSTAALASRPHEVVIGYKG